MNKYLKLIICLITPLLIGGVSGALTAQSIPTWYVTLHKPWFNPPNYLFGPVWTLLYLLMGVSLFMALQSKTNNTRKIVTVFSIQLTLNFFWSILFFNFHAIGSAIIEIVLMWLAILWMIVTFYKTNKAAGLLQIPYLLWVSFASLLNAAIWYLN